MKIKNIINESEEEKLAALGQYLIGRADDHNAASQLSIESFIAIADRLGMSVDFDTLSNMVERGVLGDVILDVDQEQIRFKSKKEASGPEGMPVDKAEAVVGNMAKRAMNRRKK